MISTVFQVALGGAIGAVARYLTGLAVLRASGAGFPLGVLVAYVIGSFLLGLFVVWAGRTAMTHLSPFVVTGLLGGYTTFSAFSLETATLIERGHVGSAALYIAVSVGGALAAMFAGIFLARGLWA